MGMGGIERGGPQISFSAFVQEGKEPRSDSLQAIAQKYLNVTVEAPALQIERFQPKKASLLDWLFDFVMHLVHGHSERAIQEHEPEVIAILSRAPMDATAADYNRLNALRDFVPSQYKERFSLWNKGYVATNLAIQSLRLDEESLRAQLSQPLPTVGNRLSALQERLGHAALAKRYPALQPLAAEKEAEAVTLLQTLYRENKAVLKDFPVLLEVLERSSLGGDVRTESHLADAQRMLAHYNSVDDFSIMQSLAEIPAESPYFHAATFALLDFATKCSTIKDGYYVDILKRHNMDPDSPTIGLIPQTAEENMLLGRWYLKKEEWARATDYLAKAASSGNMEAKFELGKLYIGLSDTKHHFLAAHLLEEVLASDQKQRLKELSPSLQKRVGDALFAEGSIQQAALWLGASAYSGDHESQWKCSFASLMRDDYTLLDDSLVTRLQDVKSPATEAVVACHFLRLFERSHDSHNFITAAAHFPTANPAMMKPLLRLIKEGSEQLLTTLAEEEPPSPEQAIALGQSLALLDTIEDFPPAKCLEMSLLFKKTAAAMAPSAEKNSLLILSANWLLRAKEVATLANIDEMHTLLAHLEPVPDITAKLASIKLDRETKPATSLSARFTGVSEETSAHVFNAAMDLLRALQPTSPLDSLFRLNAAVLSGFSERQLLELLQVLVTKTSPEIPEEPSATGKTGFTKQTLEKGIAAAREALSKESLEKGLASTRKMFGEGLAAAKGMLRRNTTAAAAAAGGAGREATPAETYDRAACGNLAAAIEKALVAKKNYAGTLFLAHYLEDQGHKAAAGKKASKVLLSANDEEKRDAAALRARVEST